jgi:hypothetical protein
VLGRPILDCCYSCVGARRDRDAQFAGVVLVQALGSASPAFRIAAFRIAGAPQRRRGMPRSPLPRSRCSGKATPARQPDRRERPVDAAWRSGAPHCQWLYGFLHPSAQSEPEPTHLDRGCGQAVGQRHHRSISSLRGLISSRHLGPRIRARGGLTRQIGALSRRWRAGIVRLCSRGGPDQGRIEAHPRWICRNIQPELSISRQKFRSNSAKISSIWEYTLKSKSAQFERQPDNHRRKATANDRIILVISFNR